MIRVFVLDDHEVVRRGLKDLLEETGDFEIVGEAALAADALHRIPVVEPDVAVLEVRLPDGSGIDVCRAIRGSHPDVAVVMLTAHDDDEALFAAIMAGAAGYLLKQTRGAEIVQAVRQVATGKSLLDPGVTQKVLARIRDGVPPADPLDLLTPQESRILDLIGQGMTNRQIADEMFLAEKTVKNYVSHLLAKLGIKSRTQAAVLATKRRRS